MGITDLIEEFLLSTIGEENEIIISRNNLAEHFSCAPSQINYVLTTRFSTDRGYLVQSKRGGGGHITIVKLQQSDSFLPLLASELLNQPLSYQRAVNIIYKLVRNGIITDREGRFIEASISDKCFLTKGHNVDMLRSNIFRNILLSIMKERT